MSSKPKHIKSFPTACEFITILASWDLHDIITILKQLSIINNYDIDASTNAIQEKTILPSTKQWDITYISPFLFQSSTAQNLQQLLTKHTAYNPANTDSLELDDLDVLLNTNPNMYKNISIYTDISNLILFLIYSRYFHSQIQNPYQSQKYHTIIQQVDKNSLSTYLLDISGNFEPFISLLLNHQIRFTKSPKNELFNSQFLTPLNNIIDFEFQIKQLMIYPLQCLNIISKQTINKLSNKKQDIHNFLLLLYHYSSFNDEATLMQQQHLNQTKLMFIISQLSVFLHSVSTETHDKYLIYFIVKAALFIILRYIRFHYTYEHNINNKGNTLNLKDCKQIFIFLLSDKYGILNNNLSALIFLICCHALICKLMDYNLIDYSTLNGHKERMKQMQSSKDLQIINDIGYIFECCLNNGYFGTVSIFNHTLNIPKYLVIYYLNQCILYVTPYTFPVQEFIDILLKNILIHNIENTQQFDEEFFVSYCMLFRNIADNVDKIIKMDNKFNQQFKGYVFIQTLCAQISEFKYKHQPTLQFNGNEIFCIGYICAFCGMLSVKKDITVQDNEEFIQTEKTLNTQIQRDICHIIPNTVNPDMHHSKLWRKCIMSAMGMLCNFNQYFLETNYITTHSFYFMDFMFDALLQSLIDILNNNNNKLFISYLNYSSYTISKLMQLTHENDTNFTKEDVNTQQYKMIKDISSFVNKYIWMKNKSNNNKQNNGIIWFCLLQILHQFAVNYADIYPKQMVTVCTVTVQIEHFAFVTPIRSQLINIISTAILKFPQEILIPFVSQVNVIKFEPVTDKKCVISIPFAYKARDKMIIHLFSLCMEALESSPTILYSHIIPFIHLYANNELITEKDIISRVHYLYAQSVKYLSLRSAYFNVPNELYPYALYDNYFVYYFEKLIVLNFFKTVDYNTLSQSFNITFGFDLKKSDTNGSGAYSKLGNVIFKSESNNNLQQLGGESMAALFNKMCINIMSKLVYYILDDLIISVRYEFDAEFDEMIVNICKLIMICNCMDNMIKLNDLNYGLFLCKKLFNLSSQNKGLMRKILRVYTDIIANCNNLIRKDHCLKWYFDLTDDIEWDSKL